jgi:hypothetical protein
MELVVVLAAVVMVNVLVWLGFGADSRDNQGWDPASRGSRRSRRSRSTGPTAPRHRTA